MNMDHIQRMLEAQLLLAIWNPDLWNWHPIKRTRVRMRLRYKAKALVLHDRALNGDKRGLE